MIRPPADRDLDAWIALWNLTQPWPRERALLLRDDARRPRDEPLLRLGAWTPEGALVGVAELTLSHAFYRIEGLGRAAVGVDPGHRRHRLGTKLAAGVDGAARGAGLERLVIWTQERDLPATGPFLQRMGGRETGRKVLAVQHPATVDLSPLAGLRESLAAKGIEVVAFAGVDSAENRRQLWQVVCTVQRDVPSPFPPNDPAFEEFEEYWFDSPVLLPGLPFIARAGGQIVGVSGLVRRPGTTDEASVTVTGVLRSHRRLGIARTLKLLAAQYARDHGFTRIYTDNDNANAPMLALNRELGFEPGPVVISFEKRFSSP